MSPSSDGSAHQRSRRRRARIVAAVLALALLVPILAGAVAAIFPG